MAPVRPRPYELKVRETLSATDTRRQTILEPNKGYRIRLVRARVVHPPGQSGQRRLWELYFGHAGNIITDLSKGVDILAIPNGGSDSTRTYLKDEGPRGRRDEPLSGRWRGVAPDTPYRIIIEYSEEP